ncbi:hypothetical protein GO496_02530 [Acidovorax citrulli]|nr:hypothetical protein [Paracidovorax citrulli]
MCAGRWRNEDPQVFHPEGDDSAGAAAASGAAGAAGRRCRGAGKPLRGPLAGRTLGTLSGRPRDRRAADCRGAAADRRRRGRRGSLRQGAIVGYGGDMEHAAALLHPLFGRAVRAGLPGAQSIMPSTAKRVGPAPLLDVPVHHVLDPWSFDHFDAVTFGIAEAPLPEEIVVALVLCAGGRPMARVAPQA